MKRALAILMALTMLVCLAVPSFADDGNPFTNVEVEFNPAYPPYAPNYTIDYPSGPEAPVEVQSTPFWNEVENVETTMWGNVNVDGNVNKNVDAFGGDVDVDGNVGQNVNAFGSDVDVTGNVGGDVDATFFSDVDVEGNVGGDVKATGSKVDVNGEKGVGGDVDAQLRAEVTVSEGDVKGQITAEGEGTEVSVGGDVGNWKESKEDAVTTTEKAVVDIDGNVIGNIKAGGELVDVDGNVIGSVDATSGEVTIGGTVFGSITADGAVVNADGIVMGNIKAANGAEVTVDETVMNIIVDANGEGTEVYLGGDMYGWKITAKDGATVIVVGEVDWTNIDTEKWQFDPITKKIIVPDGMGFGPFGPFPKFAEKDITVGHEWVNHNGEVVVGEIGKGVTFENGSQNSVFFLVGLDENSAAWADLTFEGLSEEEVAEGYRKTDASVADVQNPWKQTTITFKASDADNKVLESIEGLPEKGVKLVIDNGVATLSFAPWFKGGLQDLMVVLKDIAKVIPGGPTFYVDYGTAPVKSAAPTVISLTGAEGAEKYEFNSHVGLTFSAEYLKNAPKLSTVKVTNDTLGEELTSSQYSLQGHQDGSTTLALSNTYLNSIGAGDYQFTVTLGEDSFVLTINVPAAA